MPFALRDRRGHAGETIEGGVVAGSRGYVCVDGPLAGTVLMLGEVAEAGSLWSVADAGGTNRTYQFVGNHFEHAPAQISEEGSPES
jgi:hypothetical protein